VWDDCIYGFGSQLILGTGAVASVMSPVAQESVVGWRTDEFPVCHFPCGHQLFQFTSVPWHWECEEHPAYKSLLQLLQRLTSLELMRKRNSVKQKLEVERFNSCHSSLAHSTFHGKVSSELIIYHLKSKTWHMYICVHWIM